MHFLNIKAYQHILLHQIHKTIIFKKHHMTPLIWKWNFNKRKYKNLI